MLDDTIVAVSTAAGPGLRAVIRVSGPAAFAAVRSVATGLPPVTTRCLRPDMPLAVPGFVSPVPADVYLWPAPHTYTGQNVAEVHTIGSPPIVEALTAALLAAGARPAGPGEFTLRAFLSGKKDLTQAEAVLAVIDAGTDADLHAALTQLAGGVTKPLQMLRNDLLDLLADVEAALDFADEDIEFVAQTAILNRVAAGLAHLANLRRQLADRTVSGRAVRVVLVGAPNAGKSSLFNALAGRPAALVSPTAGTTRDYLTVALTLGGVPVELTDTAGRGTTLDAIDADAQALGTARADAAEVVVWCVPLGELLADPAPALPSDRPAVLVKAATKADLRPAAHVPPGWIATSAVAADGLTHLLPALTAAATAAARPPLAPSQARCRAHVEAATTALRRAHEHAREADPPELLALALREALAEVGALAGTVYTNDLLDRIFGRFCIGK